MSSSLIPAVFDRLGRVTLQRAADLREYLGHVVDRRARRGIRHSLGSMLVMAAVAVAAGSQSVTAIWEWVTDLPQWALAALGARFDPRRGSVCGAG